MEKAEVLSTMLAAVLVPLVIGVIGHLINQSIKSNELSLNYIRLAVGILKEEPKPSTKNLRIWAIDVVNNYSDVKLSTDARRELQESPLPLIESTDSNPLTERVEYLNQQAAMGRNIPEDLPFGISQHTLLDSLGKPVSSIETQNLSGKIREHRLVILHYTGTPSREGTVKWISNTRAKASMHIFIDRDGEVVQFVPFDYVAWHAGVSTWQDLTGLNNYSVGISFANAGRLEQKDGGWVSWTGDEYPNSEVYVQKEASGKVTGWHTYTDAQIVKAAQVIETIVQAYPIEAILAHSEVSPNRKIDPGTRFPIQRIQIWYNQPDDQIT
ncbi:MAG: N-acetylmuramoyl-L-alanine amidase [Balneolaceae bacterium]|nr:N-acetylmuramoyl-L-alanine amidase [Balneolaceae bacterium]